MADNLESIEGFTEDVNNDGNKIFSCKQCEKTCNAEKV